MPRVQTIFLDPTRVFAAYHPLSHAHRQSWKGWLVRCEELTRAPFGGPHCPLRGSTVGWLHKLTPTYHTSN